MPLAAPGAAFVPEPRPFLSLLADALLSISELSELLAESLLLKPVTLSLLSRLSLPALSSTSLSETVLLSTTSSVFSKLSFVVFSVTGSSMTLTFAFVLLTELLEPW